jgi:hypothetical protein
MGQGAKGHMRTKFVADARTRARKTGLSAIQSLVFFDKVESAVTASGLGAASRTEPGTTLTRDRIQAGLPRPMRKARHLS